MSSWDKLFSYQTLVHAVAGSVSSVTAMSVFYPLDTIRSRLQVEDREAKPTHVMLMEIIQQEGLESLYRGLQPVQTSLCVSGFVYFYAFHGLRAMFAGESGKSNSASKDLLLGSVAGAINVMLTNPMWVVNTRMKMQRPKANQRKESEKNANAKRMTHHYKGIIDGLIKITRHEGASTLWSGTVPSLMLVSNPAIQFMCYELMKRNLIQWTGSQSLTSAQIFALGAIAKSISTVLTYPLQVAQSKLRYGSDNVKGKRMVEILTDLMLNQGVTGLYKGLESKLLQTVFTTALMFLCYEKIVAFVFKLMLNQNKSI